MSPLKAKAEPDCASVREVSSRYLDGLLSEEETKALRAHAELCPDCKDILSSQAEEKELIEEALGSFRPGKSSIITLVRRLPERVDPPCSLPAWIYLPLILGAAVFFGVTVYLAYRDLPWALMDETKRIPLASLLLLNFGAAALASALILGAGRLVEFDSSSLARFFREVAATPGVMWTAQGIFGLLLVLVLFWLLVPTMGGLDALGLDTRLPPAGLLAGLLGTMLLGGFTFAVLTRLARDSGASVRAEIVALQTAGLVVLLAACATHYYVLEGWA